MQLGKNEINRSSMNCCTCSLLNYCDIVIVNMVLYISKINEATILLIVVLHLSFSQPEVFKCMNCDINKTE